MSLYIVTIQSARSYRHQRQREFEREKKLRVLCHYVLPVLIAALLTALVACWMLGTDKPAEPVAKATASQKAQLLPTTEPVLTFEEIYAEDAEYIAKAVYGEARGCSKTEQAAVVWCILNRVDSDDPFYEESIIGVVTQEDQFHGYAQGNPVQTELYTLALDVLSRWQAEKNGADDVGRVLPAEYLFFSGDGERNHFRTEWKGGETWDWSMESPYEVWSR